MKVLHTVHNEKHKRLYTKGFKIDTYYDKQIQLGQYIYNRTNQPDIIVHNKKNKRSTNNSDIGLTTTHRKTIKYTDFKNILKREWGLKM